MVKVKFIISLLKDSFSEFMEDNCLKLSAALSYYTIFSLAPLLLLVISIVSIFFGKEAFEGELYEQISGLVGKQASLQVQEIVKNAALTNKSSTAAVIGAVTLAIGATAVFAEIQDSINYIWSIKSKPKQSWLQYIKNRLLSFSVIITLGFLMIVSLGVNAMVDLLSSRLERYFSEGSVFIFSIINVALVLAIITALFTVIFKILPDGKVRWKECLVGAGFTALLFSIGKFGISFYLGQSDLGATYGASASIVILLTWIYYSSIILYFGAEFTKVYAKSDGVAIAPNDHAVLIERREAETGPSVPEPKQGMAKVASDLNPVAIKNKLFDSVTEFIDAKLEGIRLTIRETAARLTSPFVFYIAAFLTFFMILIVSTLIVGRLINQWIDSDYLGYVILLGVCLAAIAVIVMLGAKIRAFLRRALFRIMEDKMKDDKVPSSLNE
jgi:membrane protein